MTTFSSDLKRMLGAKTTWDASKITDLKGRVAIVTGGNTGIGLPTARELARHGAKVYLLCRTESRAAGAISAIKQAMPNAELEYLNFNLLSMKSAKKAAEEFLQREERLDILVNNAGIMATPYELGPDGIEEQACNGTGHFALTIPLLPILKETASKPDSHVRIVNISSDGYKLAQKPDFKSLSGLNQKGLSSWARYGNSKLSNMVFTNELQRRLEGTGIYCLTVHPGFIQTELMRGLQKSSIIMKTLLVTFKPLISVMAQTPEQGAITQLYAATSSDIEEKNMKAAYLTPGPKIAEKSAQGKDEKLGEDFWGLCEKLIAEKS